MKISPAHMTTVSLVSWEAMLKLIQPGDQLYFWNTAFFSDIIERLTKGPSHVIQIVRVVQEPSQLYHFEAVVIDGVRLFPLSHYAKDKGWKILVRRTGISAADIDAMTSEAFKVLGREYNIREEEQIALNMVLPWIKVHKTTNELFCSGLVEYLAQFTQVKFPAAKAGNSTPEDLFIDPGNTYICRVAP